MFGGKNMTDKIKLVNVSMPTSILEFIDMWRDKVSMNRSEFIREACRQYIRSLQGKYFPKKEIV